ncbi:MAG: hypothetical protein Tsb0033_08070 [Winogradskyella sp.]
MQRLPLNTSYKHHTIVALVISIWLVLFLIIIGPFDISDLNFTSRLEILPVYGLLSFTVYIVLVPIQNLIYKRLDFWNLLFESLFIIVFNFIQIFTSYFYYKSKLVNGEYDFQPFLLKIYLPVGIILLTVIIFSRWFLNKKINSTKNSITIKGENKLDILKIQLEDLICVSSADNYVEVNYLEKGSLQKKLLRNTLKAVQNDIPELLKVHRSHLINPIHFKEWNGSESIKLNGVDIPVSKKYKSKVMELV